MLVVIALSHELAIIQIECGYIVPEASHLNITIDARSGRVLVAEHKVMSSSPSCHNRFKCNFVSQSPKNGGCYPFLVSIDLWL